MILTADIGGTNCRFACVYQDAGKAWQVKAYTKFQNIDYPDFATALGDYINSLDAKPQYAAFVAAGPLQYHRQRGDEIASYIKLTNHDWCIDSAQIQQEYGFKHCGLYNDFSGMTRSVVELDESAVLKIRDGQGYDGAPILVAGAGTGFGVGYLIPITTLNPTQKHWHIMPTEGGRIRYSPQKPIEFELVKILARNHDVVTLEMICAGKNLNKVHAAICEIHRKPYEEKPPELIRQMALAGDPICLDIYQIQAAAAMGGIGDLALSGGARGGIVLAGGVSEHMVGFYQKPDAMSRYLNRGSLSDYMQAIPMHIIKDPKAPLIGAAALLYDNL